MNKFSISARILSSIFWDTILRDFTTNLEFNDDLFKKIKRLDQLVENADYKTGSISNASAIILYYLTIFFKPQNILEIGTFIGKSTIAMAKGMDDKKVKNPYLCTCDGSNDIDLPWKGRTKIKQYKKVISTEMLKQESKLFDFLFFDGRLMPDDLSYIENLSHKNTLVILDDFEGIEKGVINLITIRKSEKFKNYFLIYPPSNNILNKINPFSEPCPVAILLPASLVTFVNQG